jgi:carbon monoxide dehydrogenase subunit G
MRYERAVEIDATAEQVWARLVDVENGRAGLRRCDTSNRSTAPT